MRTGGLIVAAVLASASGAASAQAVADDARCLLVSSTYARTSTDPKAIQVAQAAAAFYLGRVDGRYPPAALKAALSAEQKQLTPANAPGIMNTCAGRVGQAEARIQAMAPAAPAGSAAPAAPIRPRPKPQGPAQPGR